MEVAFVAALVALIAAFALSRKARMDRIAREQGAAQVEAEGVMSAARAEAAAERARADVEARQTLLAVERTAQDQAAQADDRRRNREDGLGRDALSITAHEARQQERASSLETRQRALSDHDRQRSLLENERKKTAQEEVAVLERAAGEGRGEVIERLRSEWVDDARAHADDRMRQIEAGANDPERGREAKRVMGIAIQRYAGHYLTERLLSNLPLAPGFIDRLFGPDRVHLPLVEEISNVKLTVADDGLSVRLEGQDSFGREIARRTVAKVAKHGWKPDAKKMVEDIREQLEREVFDLGKKAFKELEIPRAHPDIVRLVGRLNWRTSYTQNQWKHAVEVAFLCGMMAAELGLDVKVARRAALMHDIGKSLTHAIDGSHAVIGADYARRLGESELVANAIGAHHTDEPFNSTYAYLVAAADALSGARPGARREQMDNYAEKLADLERIGRGFRGVDSAFAVQGGREVRVYVEEHVPDLRAVELSTEIAKQISDEMTFPGQIKVTVIREKRAVEIAG
jgi:ribonuclease Y